MPEEELEAAVAFAEAVYPAVLKGDADAVEAILRDAAGSIWDRLSDDDRAVAGEREVVVQRAVDIQLPTLISDWFRSLLASDPQADWSRVTVPVLGLFGARDPLVPLELNEPALREALAAAGNDDATAVVFPEANHLFQDAETGAPEEYAELEPVFTVDFLPTLVDWVTARAGVDG